MTALTIRKKEGERSIENASTAVPDEKHRRCPFPRQHSRAVAVGSILDDPCRDRSEVRA
jgi:hypothetical protein